MATPVPVPSKAAIHALRGLVFGTSCTLVLVTEDRRRRINAARDAIRNGDRIRSARRYHPGGSDLAIALEEEAHRHTQDLSCDCSPASSSSSSSPAPETAKPTLPKPKFVAWSSPIFLSDETASTTANLLSKSTSTSLEAELKKASPVPTDPETHPESKTTALFSHPPQQILRSEPSLASRAQEYKALALAAHHVQQSSSPPAPDFPVITAEILKLAEARDPAGLARAVELLQSTRPKRETPSSAAPSTLPPNGQQLAELCQASAKLCVACQETERMDLAQTVLLFTVRFAELDEDTYFAHNPLPVVESLTPHDVLESASESEIDIWLRRRSDKTKTHAHLTAALSQLQLATAAFLPVTLTSTTRPVEELVAAGKRVLQCAFALRRQKSIRRIFDALRQHPGNMTEFTLWYLQKLKESKNTRMAVWAFLARPIPADGLLLDPAFYTMGNTVVEAALASLSSRNDEILVALLDMSTPQRPLRTAWVTELLYGYWTTSQDFAKTASVFARVTSHRKAPLLRHVDHVDAAYRVMVQVALEADEQDKAAEYFAELVKQQPQAATDIRLLGLFALHKAKMGDWQGVQDDFTKVKTSSDSSSSSEQNSPKDAERVFVPIAKEYVQTHTIDETERFIKLYVDELGVSIGRELVTLLSNEYGQLREVQSFVGWLEYCSQAGFEVDAAFSNAILHSCHRHWKFCFNDLRSMYRKLRVLHPNFEDTVTQNIMRNAALSQGKCNGRSARGRLLSLRIAGQGCFQTKVGTMVSPLSTGKVLTDENELYVAMKERVVLGSSLKAVRIYKQALRQRVPRSKRCLKLAVAAAVRVEKADTSSSSHTATAAGAGTPLGVNMAVELINEAHAAGQEIDEAASYLAVAYVESLEPKFASMVGDSDSKTGRHGQDDMTAAVRTILRRLETHDVTLSDLALNRAAFHLFKAGRMRGAVALARSAADTIVGGGQLGYNAFNYSVLVGAYGRLADAAGVHSAVEGAAANDVSGAMVSFRMLKQVRRQLRRRADRYGNTPEIEATMLAVEDGLARARAARNLLGEEQRQLETAALRIMQQAALDADHGNGNGNGNGGKSEDADFDQWRPSWMHNSEKAAEVAKARGNNNDLASSLDPLLLESGTRPLVVC